MRLVSLNKDPKITVKEDIATFLNPDYIYIPIWENKLLVQQNTKVLKGSYIFQNNRMITSPISGTVIGLKVEQNTKYVVIQNDYKEKRINSKRPNINKLNIDTILSSLELHSEKRLLNIFRSLKKTTNIIINVIDDEPYSKTRIMLMKEHITEVLNLINELSLIYHSQKNIICFKASESSLVEECLNIIGSYPNINMALVDDLYLLGENFYLVNYLSYKEENCLCISIEDLLKLYSLIYNNDNDYEKLITISGDALKNTGQVFKVKKYTDAMELINKKIKLQPGKVVYFAGGVMKGAIKDAHELIITDDIQVINIMQKKEVQTSACFNCGKCVNICPVNINCRLRLKQNKMDKKCLNCGLCSYICPSYIDIKKIIRGEQ